MRQESVFLFFILFSNAIVLISDFRLFKDKFDDKLKIDKRKKDESVKEDGETIVKKSILDNIPSKISERLENSVKSSTFPKTVIDYLGFDIESVEINESLPEKVQPVSKKNLTISETGVKKDVTKITTEIETKNQTLEITPETQKSTLKDVLTSIKKDFIPEKPIPKKKTEKKEPEIIEDTKIIPQKNVSDTKKETVMKVPEKKMDLVREPKQIPPKLIEKKSQPIKPQNITPVIKDMDPENQQKTNIQGKIKIEPTPQKVAPLQKKVDPIPKKVEPTPKKVESAPKNVEPVPKKVEPVPKKVVPLPKKVVPVPKKVELVTKTVEIQKEIVVGETKKLKLVDPSPPTIVQKPVQNVTVEAKKKPVSTSPNPIQNLTQPVESRKKPNIKIQKSEPSLSKAVEKTKKVIESVKPEMKPDPKKIEPRPKIVEAKKTPPSLPKQSLKKVKPVENKVIPLKELPKKPGSQPKKTVTQLKLRTDDQTYIELSNYYLDFQNAKSDRCKIEGEEFENELEIGKLWALKMFDSSAQIPSGILKGNLNQFGDFDQCLNIYTKIMKEHKKEKDMKITGKYCLASIDIEAKEDYMKLPVNLAQGRAFLRSRNKDPGHFIPKFSTIRWGVCVPASCSAADVQNMLTAYVEQNNQSFSDIKLNIAVDSDQCVAKAHLDIADIEYPTIASVFLLTTLISISIAATIRDYLFLVDNRNNSTVDKIFMAFSLKQTKKSFLNDASSDEISCVHGIRALTTILLYIAHKLIPMGHSPYTNRVLLTEMSNNPISIILRVSIIYTDTFLLLSGFLTAYHMSKDLDVRGHIPWVNRIFSRLIRLSPTLIVVLLYYSYIMDEVGNGPLWNTVVKENADLCKESWWKNALFIQNLYPFEDMCATHTHQLALDMQLFLLAPALVWLLQNRTYFGLFIMSSLHLLSAGLRYYTTIRYKLSVIIYHGISLNQLYRTANLLYASSIHRATPYLAGICLGVTLRQIRPDFHLPKLLSLIGWMITGYLTYWIFYTPSHLADRMFRYNVNEAAIFSSLCSVAWAFVLSWIIFSSQLNYEGYLNKCLSSKSMVLLSKLSYTMYLVQFIIFFYNVGTIKTPLEFNLHEVLNILEFAIVIVVSVMLFLVVDLPIQEIKKILMRPTKQSHTNEIVKESDNNDVRESDDSESIKEKDD